jgi:formylglycine-generating enzyme required for sulfatase activity
MRYTIFTLLLSLIFLSASSPEPLRRPHFRPGKDHAILFAVNTYKAPLTNLSNPITNAEQIAAELKNRFGFEPVVYKNYTAAQIEQTLLDYTNRFARNLNGQYPADGQLFIFFSGHGTERLENGYFLPSDADANNLRQTALPYSYLRPLINDIKCQHILVAVDACYSLSFDENYKKRPDFEFRRPGELNENDKIVANHQRYKARVFFTSDAVGDMTPDKSGFAKKLLEGLRTFNSLSGFMTSSELFANYLQKAAPTPHGGEFGSDEAGSSFLFFSTSKPSIDPLSDVRAWNDAKATNTLEAYRNYLRNFPQGEFRELAEQRAKTFELKNTDYNNWQKAKQSNTRPAYEQYLRENPSGEYRELAEAALQRLTPALNDNMVLIPGGSFQMGSNDGESDEKPVHEVRISSFYLSKYEVTVGEFKQFIDATSYQTDADKDGGSSAWDGKAWTKTAGVNWKCDPEGKARPSTAYNHPVIHVSWNDATEYAKWLSKKTGLNYRLPTEAEWEYAAGNGNKHTKYSWGNSNPAGKQGGNVADETGASKFNWTKSTEYIFVGYNDGFASTAPVGSFNANELGLHDMSGNVWEWCQDWYGSDYYAKSPASNPSGPTSGSFRVYRGGSWYYDPILARVAFRSYFSPGLRVNYLGFRLARQQ